MIITNSDGGARGNPGPGAIGVLVRDGNTNQILSKYAAKIGNYTTNNIAEYEALIKALELASRLTDKEITCILDSELVVNQLLGKYKVRDEKLMHLFLKVQKLQEKFEKILYKHVSREDVFQGMCDEMLNDVLDREFGKSYKRRYRR